jgi:hypothetical protein
MDDEEKRRHRDIGEEQQEHDALDHGSVSASRTFGDSG